MATTKKSAASATNGEQEVPNPAGNTGPGTGTDAPPETVENRPPATIIADPEGAPLDPPTDVKTQAQPAAGYNESSTDPVYAATAGRTIAGEDYAGLVDADGKAVSAGSIFETGEENSPTVTVKNNVYEEFYYPGTTTKATRLLLVAGQTVPRAQADGIKKAVEDAPEPRAEQ